MLKAHHVVDAIERQQRTGREPVRFYWVALTAEETGPDRERFKSDLRAVAAGYPLQPVVLRTHGFRDPNAVMNDLATVVEGARDDLLEFGMCEQIVERGFVDIVLISRREFGLAITSSPLQLPEWFPVSPSELVTAKVTDLTWSADVALSAPEARLGDLRRLLHELDGVLLSRLRTSRDRDRNIANSFLGLVGAEDEPVAEVLANATNAWEAVKNPRDYRPSRTGATMVCRLWYTSTTKHPERVVKPARILSRALGVAPADLDDHKESIVAVLGRPTNPVYYSDIRVRWAFDLIVTVGGACQFATAAAHADAYARYPVMLVRSISESLRESLDGFVKILDLGPL